MTQTLSNRVQATIRSAISLSGIGLAGVSLVTPAASFAQTPVGDPSITDPAPAAVTPAPTTVAPIPIAPPEPMPRSFPAEFAKPAPRSVPVPAASANAADGYIAPNTIIFSERSSGCRAVLSGSQAPVDSICSGASQSSAGAATAAIAPPANQSGTAAVGTVSAPIGRFGATPSLRDFYRRTVRPPALLGNSNIRLIFPLAIPAPISSLFGWRVHPITGDARFHTGTDLAAPIGTPVLAAFAGQIAIADFLGGYGLTVAIDHTKGTQQTLYAHLSEVFVKSGDLVKQGEVIGRVGSTGNSTGAHLHFEFRQQTPDGWVALDAGDQLEYALAQLVQSLEIAQATSAPVKANAGVQGTIQ